MTERIGICTGCGAHYGNIPPTVSATKVRCRQCGGTVEIPPLAAPAPGSLQARPLGETRPKGNGERPASAAPVDRSITRPAAAPLPAAAAQKDPDKSAAVLAKLKARKQNAAPAAPQPGLRKPPAPTPAPAHARKKPASRHAHDEEEGHHHHAHPHVKKGPPVALTLVSVVALAGVGSGLWWLSQQGSEAAASVDQGAAAPVVPAPPATTLQPGAPAGQAPAPASSESTAPAAGGAAEAEAPPRPAAPAHVEPAWAPPEPGGTILSSGYLDPDSIRLGEVPLLPKWSGTSDEDWSAMVADLELFLADEGASSTRAGNRLVAGGRGAFPVLLNGMLRTNWDDLDSISLGHSLNNKLTEIGKGSNWDWKDVHLYEPDTAEWRDAVLFDKKVVTKWYNLWVTKLAVDDRQWEGFTKSAADKKADAEKADPAARDLAPPTRPVIDD